jgi:hypothetical protein
MTTKNEYHQRRHEFLRLAQQLAETYDRDKHTATTLTGQKIIFDLDTFVEIGRGDVIKHQCGAAACLVGAWAFDAPRRGFPGWDFGPMGRSISWYDREEDVGYYGFRAVAEFLGIRVEDVTRFASVEEYEAGEEGMPSVADLEGEIHTRWVPAPAVYARTKEVLAQASIRESAEELRGLRYVRD